MTTSFSTHLAGPAGWDQLASQAPAHLSANMSVSCRGAADHMRQQIVAALRETVQRFDWILSATLTGSFLHGSGLEGISDIDFVVIVDDLNAGR
ncbi:MAG TPA: nucleotidyltransferase domain-containing protein, partial [Pirellulaceae bacterium]|nr:nucleotidyltransferase domain-containing protein [Pirellulaceae bacterium]